MHSGDRLYCTAPFIPYHIKFSRIQVDTGGTFCLYLPSKHSFCDTNLATTNLFKYLQNFNFFLFFINKIVSTEILPICRNYINVAVKVHFCQSGEINIKIFFSSSPTPTSAVRQLGKGRHWGCWTVGGEFGSHSHVRSERR